MRHTATLTIRRPPGWLRWWRKVRYPKGVFFETNHRLGCDGFALFVPYSLRRAHRWYANRNHLYWLPCVLCGVPYGGHEGRRVAGRPDQVPDPTHGGWQTICPRCTKAGRGLEIRPLTTR